MKMALIVVDVQNDFCPGGALAVENGDEVVRPANELTERFLQKDLPVYFTRDWHPQNHVSFEKQGGQWPPHCVQRTEGAQFHPDLNVPDGATIVSKGDDPDKDAYSGFDGTDLGGDLEAESIDRVVVVGLATDYCVKETVLDALRLGFDVTVVPEGVRGVNVEPGDAGKAVAKMKEAGAQFVPLDELTVQRQ